MNQILSVNMPNNKEKKVKDRNSKPVDIVKILQFFVIFLMIYGVLVIGMGVYGIIHKQEVDESNSQFQPTFDISESGTDKVMIKVTSTNKNISKLEYRWNNDTSTVVNGTGTYIEKEVSIPSGNNTLHVTVTDENGNQVSNQKQFERESNIKIQVVGTKIKITSESDSTISYMTYKWDDGEEQTVQVNDTKLEKEIDTEKGLHTLTVKTVDENNNIDTKEQKIKAVSKPTVSVQLSADGYFEIKASDDDELSTVDIWIDKDDNKHYQLNLDGKNMKELDYVLQQIPLHDGANYIQVVVKNASGLTEQSGTIQANK